MSLKYIDHNGVSHDIAGLSPGGNIEMGAVATRSGSFGINFNSGASVTKTVTFTDPMPDDDYEVMVYGTYGNESIVNCVANTVNKTANGFEILFYYIPGTTGGSYGFAWKAFKLYTVAEAEQLASAVDDIEAMIPASASSSNKFATVGDLSTETRSLDRRIDSLEDAVPVGTGINNQLINQTQLTNAIENVEIDVDDALDSTSENPVQNKVITNALQNVEIDVDSSISGTSENPVQNKVIKAALNKKEDVQFTGTKAEWDALTTAEKKEYKIANITDDVVGGEVADTVADGDMRPVTSNAVYDYLGWTKLGTYTYSQTANIPTCKELLIKIFTNHTVQVTMENTIPTFTLTTSEEELMIGGGFYSSGAGSFASVNITSSTIKICNVCINSVYISAQSTMDVYYR